MITINVHSKQMIPTFAELQKMATESVDGWLRAVRIFYNADYNFDEKTQQEREWLESVRVLLEQTCIPDKFKTGAHILHRGSAYMGEDICIYEGHILHTLHCKHKECGLYEIVNWNVPYCVHCKKIISHDDTG